MSDTIFDLPRAKADVRGFYPLLDESRSHQCEFPFEVLSTRTQQQCWRIEGLDIPGWPHGTSVLTRRTKERRRRGVVYLTHDHYGRGTLGYSPSQDSNELRTFRCLPIRIETGFAVLRVAAFYSPLGSLVDFDQKFMFHSYGFVFRSGLFQKAHEPEEYRLDPLVEFRSFHDVYWNMVEHRADRQDKLHEEHGAVWMSLSERVPSDPLFHWEAHLPRCALYGVTLPDPLPSLGMGPHIRVLAFTPHEEGPFEERKVYAIVDPDGNTLFSVVRDGRPIVHYVDGKVCPPREGCYTFNLSPFHLGEDTFRMRYLKLVGVFGPGDPGFCDEGFRIEWIKGQWMLVRATHLIA